MKKLLIVASFLLIACFTFAGGQQEKSEGFSGDYAFGGSTTVEPVALAAIEVFMEKYPDVNISYDSQGSSVGVKGAISGTYSLGGASRELKDSEAEQGAKSIHVGLDGVAVIANKDTVNVSNLSFDEVGLIFAGQITNWKEVGGPDQPIAVFNRDEASGTRDCFKMTVKPHGGDFVDTAAIVTSNGDMVSKVGSTPYSIGYCGFGYLAKDPGIKPVSVNGVDPEEANVVNESYKISRYLNLVYTGELAEGTLEKAFVDFLLSDDGQAIVAEEKFIPLQ